MTTMYSLRPIIHHDELPERSSDCMYEMKNIHRNGHTRQDCRIDSNVTSQSPLPEVKALETRQEKILVQLAELKAQVLSLCDVLKSNENPKSPRKSKREPVTADFVVNVNPESPAYSLLALKKLWSDVDFRIEPFQHSSVQGVIPEGFGRTRGCGESVISISLIWKKVNNAELVLSSLHESRILGEVNLLRYLSRLLDNHDSLPPEEATKIDGILDLSHQLVSQDNLKIKLSIINILDKKITNGNWFSTRKTPGIGDVAVWSALKQISPKSLPSNLASWYQKCEKSLNV
ncbi:probable aminoacyl tRNA synthase complex-interacting multifunctional protein 2 isoform X2 [Fopius arisanus]|uniref:Probable aminoacyl tRNA synthase complex-interacting multifunctional protein 2 isoform X2 n=1 Tax=Fopius arisanus TaxID=64838 RepID=A0A9R1U568_9HYME|nr:PREDICTED: probable aminoacyl tRNA synthase complex-interacting multifunctional protein 2 isoform X2 [Fopius arisanus]